MHLFIYTFIYAFIHLGALLSRDSHCIQGNLYMHLFMYNECKNRVHCLLYYIKLVQNDVYLNKFPNTH